MAIQSYRELEVWKISMDLVVAIYNLCSLLPQDEKYGLVSQLRRASVSVPANIAEGYGRIHRGEYIHHLAIARGSLMELETLLLIVSRVELASDEQIKESWELSQRSGQMLTKLINSLKNTKRN